MFHFLPGSNTTLTSLRSRLRRRLADREVLTKVRRVGNLLAEKI